MRLLAVDFGLKKIGLAFAQTVVVEPLKVLKLEKSDFSRNSLVYKKIALICQDYKVEKIVIGLPEGK